MRAVLLIGAVLLPADAAVIVAGGDALRPSRNTVGGRPASKKPAPPFDSIQRPRRSGT